MQMFNNMTHWAKMKCRAQSKTAMIFPRQRTSGQGKPSGGEIHSSDDGSRLRTGSWQVRSVAGMMKLEHGEMEWVQCNRTGSTITRWVIAWVKLGWTQNLMEKSALSWSLIASAVGHTPAQWLLLFGLHPGHFYVESACSPSMWKLWNLRLMKPCYTIVQFDLLKLWF